jgi:hypothetical protein
MPKLELNADRLIVLAGKIPDDIREEIIKKLLEAPETVALFRKTKNIKYLIEEE